MSSLDLMQVVNDTHPFVSFPEPKHLFQLNAREFLRRGLRLPQRVASTGLDALTRRGRVSVLDVVFGGLGEALPSGIYDMRAYREWLRQALQAVGGTDRFDELPRHLHIIATQLDTGERKVFSSDTPEVSLADAIAASSAVPVIYRPVRIGNAEYVDGGVRGNASLDLAIEHGAKLVVCINSLVPYQNPESEAGTGRGASGHFISERGLEAVSAQATRVLLHSGLQYQIKQLQRRHPDVDIILIEPSPSDSVMFFANIMRLKDRIAIAEHGYRSVSVDLAGGYEVFQATLARYGIEISSGRIRADLEEIRRSGHDPAVVQRVLAGDQQLPAGSDVSSPVDASPLTTLQSTLERLEVEIDRRGGALLPH
jgi:NTE family protein